MTMLPYADASAKILAAARTTTKKTVLLEKALGYVLAEPVLTKFALPSFDNSAVDGFGVCLSDVKDASPENAIELTLLGEIRAGASQEFQQTPGTAIKILTGAIVPANTEAVIMREYCQEVEGKVRISQSAQPGENIRRKGAEVKLGGEVLAAGIRISPPVLALLATIGEEKVIVHAKPRVAIVITGDELVRPGKALKPGQIFDSNSYALRAALECLGIDDCRIFYARDSLAETVKAFTDALNEADVVISSGGVSVGDHDYVKEALEARGVQTIFWQIAIKPGKPVFFGRHLPTGKLVFALPGNPVSVLVTYHQFVKPALKKMMGVKIVDTPNYMAKLSTSIKKKAGRLDFMRGRLSPAETGILVTPVRGQDSHMLTGLATADCLLHFAAEAEAMSAGSDIPIQMLNWFD